MLHILIVYPAHRIDQTLRLLKQIIPASARLGNAVNQFHGKKLYMTNQSNFPENAPFTDFRHCPRCGTASLYKYDGRAIRCGDCGFVLYFNCATAVAAFVIYQGKLLLGVRGKEPEKGMLDFPGGFVEFDETAENALAREVHEEFNIHLSSLVYLASFPNDYLYEGLLYKTTDLYFICHVNDISSLKVMDEVTEFLLVAPEEVDLGKLAFASGRNAFRRFLAYLDRSVPCINDRDLI